MLCFIMFVTAGMFWLKELADALNSAYNNWDGRCVPFFLAKSFMIKFISQDYHNAPVLL